MIIMMIVKDEIVPFIADVEELSVSWRHPKSYLGTTTLLGHCTWPISSIPWKWKKDLQSQTSSDPLWNWQFNWFLQGSLFRITWFCTLHWIFCLLSLRVLFNWWLVKSNYPHLKCFSTNYFWKNNEGKPSLASKKILKYFSFTLVNITTIWPRTIDLGEDVATLMENNKFTIMNNSHKHITRNATTTRNGDIRRENVLGQKKTKVVK